MKQITLPPTPPKPQPIKLQKIATRPPIQLNKISTPNNPQLPRKIEEIMADIQNLQTQKITPLEWIYCLHTKPQWDKQNPDLAIPTAETIWQEAITNPAIKNPLIWRLSLYQTNNQTPLPPSLIETFPTFANNAKGNDTYAVQIINTLPHPDAPKNLAKLSWQYAITPQQLTQKAGIPLCLSPIQNAYNYLAGIFPPGSNPNKKEAEWLLNCLQEMSPQQQIIATEELLTKISPDVAIKMPQFLEFIQNKFNQNQLSPTATTILNKCLGAINYSKFEQLINLLARMLRLEDSDRQKLEEKRDFWANYSERIQKIRFLLPQTSIDTLGYQLQQKVDTFKKNEPTEVCIFAFEKSIVIEILRDQTNEAHLLPRTPQNERLLFQSSGLTLKRLRSLETQVFDRVYLWQFFYQQFLQEKNIYPNDDIEYFKGLPKNIGRYSKKAGLELPTGPEIKQREKQLKQWQKDIAELTKKTWKQKNPDILKNRVFTTSLFLKKTNLKNP